MNVPTKEDHQRATVLLGKQPKKGQERRDPQIKLFWFSKIVFKIPYARNYNPQLEYVEDDFFVFKDTFLENSD